MITQIDDSHSVMEVVHHPRGRAKKWRLEKIILTDQPFVKPEGGIWASPVGSLYGWQEWCVDEGFPWNLSTPVHLTLSTDDFLVLDRVDDLGRMDWHMPYPSFRMEYPHFTKMRERGIDAIYMTVRGQRETRFSVPRNLYGWDCECVLILNERCILSYRTLTGKFTLRGKEAIYG